ncbi:hypothetical protein HYW21_02825 [Candidatus Woesearchaeota archaeon]|nr:hypothetical protein [Candidatus Woesearchaeota archaeon]
MMKTVPVATTLERLLHFTETVYEPWRDHTALRSRFASDLHERGLLSPVNLTLAAQSIALLELGRGGGDLPLSSDSSLASIQPIAEKLESFLFDISASLVYTPEHLQRLIDEGPLELSQRSVLDMKGRLNRYLRNLLLLNDVWYQHPEHRDELRGEMYHRMQDQFAGEFDLQAYAGQLSGKNYLVAELPQQTLEAILQDLFLATTHTRAKLQAHLNEVSRTLYGGEVVRSEPTTARLRTLLTAYDPHHPLSDWATIELAKRIVTSDARLLHLVPEYFSSEYFAHLRKQIVNVDGYEGRIGGKTAGIFFAAPIIHREMGDDARYLRDPHQFVVDTSISDAFFTHNRLLGDINQMKWTYAGAVHSNIDGDIEDAKTKIEDLQQKILAGEFPSDVVQRLRRAYGALPSVPLAVRSSSLLEDGVNAPFPGVYETVFVPNASPDQEQNFAALLHAIKTVYASVLSPGAFQYRLDTDLLNADERMAVLVQEVQGHREGRYFFPDLAGVVFSRATRAPDSTLDLKKGCARIVVGLGTRAVDIDDNAHLLYFQRPAINPTTEDQRGRYAQHRVDVIDLEDNSFRTLPVKEFLDSVSPSGLRASGLPVVMDRDDGIVRPYPPFHNSGHPLSPYCDIARAYGNSQREGALRHGIRIIERMKDILRTAYDRDVDLEFAINFVTSPDAVDGWSSSVSLVQCRPQYNKPGDRPATMPSLTNGSNLTVLYQSTTPESNGSVPNIEYLLVVDPSRYATLGPQGWSKLSMLIDVINRHYAHEAVALAAPGRWGSTHPNLGVPVRYEQINNTRAMIEMVRQGNEPTNGSHFFQQIEARGIHMVTMYVRDGDTSSLLFPPLEGAPNLLSSDKRLANFSDLDPAVRLLHVPAATHEQCLHLAMNYGNRPPQPNVLIYLGPKSEGNNNHNHAH